MTDPCTVFCEECGDCLDCRGEDPCHFTADGEHVPPPIISQEETGLTPSEQSIMNLLVAAYNKYISLPLQHPSDKQEFSQAIHRLQGMLSIRIVRRDYPKGWYCKQEE